MNILEVLKFVFGFLGMMALIGVCLLIVGYIGKKDRQKKAEEEKKLEDNQQDEDI